MAGIIKVEAGGRTRPFRFKYRAIKSFAADLEVEQLEELPSKLSTPTFEMIEALIYHGFKAGAEYEKEPVEFDREEIAEWLEENMTFFKPCLELAQKQLLEALRGPGKPARKGKGRKK